MNQGVKPGNPISYKVKTLSITKEPVSSIGGFKVLPDYGLNDMPENYAGLVLIGGMNWFSPLGELIVPLVEKAVKENKLVAGICNASVFLGMHGFLNEVKHTSNTLDYLKQYAGDKYTGDSNYINKQAVRDGNIVTANGTGKLVHICMYFGMSGMLWLEFLRAHRRDEAPLWHAWVGAFFCPVLFSGCVELLQEYCTSYRGGDWLDFAANSTGALLASLVAYYVVRPRMMKQ